MRANASSVPEPQPTISRPQSWNFTPPISQFEGTLGAGTEGSTLLACFLGIGFPVNGSFRSGAFPLGATKHPAAHRTQSYFQPEGPLALASAFRRRHRPARPFRPGARFRLADGFCPVLDARRCRRSGNATADAAANAAAFALAIASASALAWASAMAVGPPVQEQGRGAWPLRSASAVGFGGVQSKGPGRSS